MIITSKRTKHILVTTGKQGVRVVGDKEYKHICPRFEKTFTLLGKRWTALIIRMLMDDNYRFSEIEQMIPGISSRMLSERLRELEHEEIVIRNVYADIPVRIEYGLTKKGQSLAQSLDPLQKWAEYWIK